MFHSLSTRKESEHHQSLFTPGFRVYFNCCWSETCTRRLVREVTGLPVPEQMILLPLGPLRIHIQAMLMCAIDNWPSDGRPRPQADDQRP